MCLNRTSEWNVMTIWISRELLLFYFERLDDISWASIIHPCQNLWPFELDQSFRVKFWASWYIMCLNRTSKWKVMTILISRELPLFNFERLDMWHTWIVHPSEKLGQFEFLYSFRCSISSISICEAPESDIRVKSYDHLNISSASVVQFRVSRYIMRLNRTSEWKVMTIWKAQELPLFNFERHDILCAWIRPPS